MNSRIQLEEDNDDSDILICPLCGGNYLHHESIDVFERKEDDKEGLHSTISGSGVNIIYDKRSANPSRRRNGLRIKFSCENCQSDIPNLIISQHKGQTIIKWDT